MNRICYPQARWIASVSVLWGKWSRCAMVLAIPVWGSAQQLPQQQDNLRTDLRSAVRQQKLDADAAKKAQQAGIAAQKMAQITTPMPLDNKHLTSEDRALLRKQLVRELRAQQ